MQRPLELQIGEPSTANSPQRFPLLPLVCAQPVASDTEEFVDLFLLWSVGIFGRHLASVDAIEDSDPASYVAGRIQRSLQSRQIKTAFAVCTFVTRGTMIG